MEGLIKPVHRTCQLDFSIPVFGDTQQAHVAGTYDTVVRASVDWINAEATRANVPFCLHVGDIVGGSPTAQEWDDIKAEWDRLNVPMYAVPGNWDLDAGGGSVVDLDCQDYNDHVPDPRLHRWPCNTFVGVDADAPSPPRGAPIDTHGNGYALVDAWNTGLIVIWAEFGHPRDKCEKIMQTLARYPDRLPIILLHDYLGVTQVVTQRIAALCSDVDTSNSAGARGHSTAVEGREMHRDYLRHAPGPKVILCGHIHSGAPQLMLGPRYVLGVYGPYNEVGSNYDFSQGAAGWIVPPSWGVSNEKATHTPGTAASLRMDDVVCKEVMYTVRIVLSGITAGTLTLNLGNNDDWVLSTNGTHVRAIEASDETGSDVHGNLNMLASSDFDGSVEEVHVEPEGQYAADGSPHIVTHVNYQSDPATTDGRLRLFHFKPARNRLEVRTIDPFNGMDYPTVTNETFDTDLDLQRFIQAA